MKGNGQFYPTFAEVQSHLNLKEQHLLIGNGFSQSYSSTIFSYNALANQLRNSSDKDLINLFDTLKTDNFEEIMSKLDTAISIIDNYQQDKKLLIKLNEDKKKLRLELIKNIEEMHPEKVFSVTDENTNSCYDFIEPFFKGNNSIISTNYDLLLYWVTMRKSDYYTNQKKTPPFCDGFSYSRIDTEDRFAKKELKIMEDFLTWKPVNKQNIFYLHGALHLFDKKTSILKEQYKDEKFLMNKIRSRMAKDEYPIFVMAGNGDEKLKHILHNQYLSNCYHHLTNISGSLITYGLRFGESEKHIIDAINKASQRYENSLESIYIGVYNDEDISHVESIKNKFALKVNTYDVKTIKLWKK